MSVFILNYMISDEVFAAGLEACLNEEDKNQSACVFVFADMNKVNSGLRERTEYIMDKYEANHQYLYFSYHESFDKKEWETIYEREYDSGRKIMKTAERLILIKHKTMEAVSLNPKL